MKTKKIILLSVCVILIENVYSQFILNGPNFGNTITTMRGIGIGDFFANTAVPTSRFHINNFYCNQPNGSLSGFLFRTDGRNNVENKWELYIGTTSTTLSEKFKLYVPANTNHVFLQASRSNGIMGFNTSGVVATVQTPFTRMSIQDGAGGVNTGFVSMGNNLLIGFTPLDRLHLHQDAASDVRTRFTHSTATSGSTLGINNAGQYLFTQFENQAMIFETNGTNERFRITHDDRIFAFRNVNFRI